MIRHLAPLAATALVALSGCAANADSAADRTPPGQQVSYNSKETLDQALKGLVPGQPVTCLPLGRAPTSEAYGSTVLYREGRRRLWRNDLGPGCENLGRRGDIMVSSTPMGQFCRGDIIRLVDRVSGFTTGSCAYNDFIPYGPAPGGAAK